MFTAFAITSIILISVFCLIAGGGIGYLAGYKKHSKQSLTKRHERNLSDSTIPSAFDMQVSMIEDACQETKKKSEEEKRHISKAYRISKRNIDLINKLIKNRAAKGHTNAHVTVISEVDKETDWYGSPSETVVKATDDTMGHVAGILRDIYKLHGYEVDAVTDIDWRGNIFFSVYIDWSENFDAERLGEVEFSSQVEAFKAGVPLEDILA